jgi:FixJ family two-component response regulator
MDRGTLVAIVDDDQLVRDALLGLMREARLEARVFASAEEFLTSDILGETGCLIVDIRMPGLSGLELQQRLTAIGYQIPTVVITAQHDARTRSQAVRAGALECLAKPFDDDVLLDIVRAALKRKPSLRRRD